MKSSMPSSDKPHAGPHHVVAGTQQFCHPQHTPDPGMHSGGKGLAQAGKVCQGSVSVDCSWKVLVDRNSVGRVKTAKTVKQIHRRELADRRGNMQSQFQAESHVLSPQQGSSTASSRETTRLRGHTHMHITMTNPTVSTARDMSAWPAQNHSSRSQILSSTGNRKPEMPCGQAKHTHCRSQLHLREGLLLLPDWNPTDS